MSPFATVAILVALFLGLIVAAVLVGSPGTRTPSSPAKKGSRPTASATPPAPSPSGGRGKRAVLSRDEREELLSSTRNLASSDPEATARLLRNWLSDDLA